MANVIAACNKRFIEEKDIIYCYCLDLKNSSDRLNCHGSRVEHLWISTVSHTFPVIYGSLVSHSSTSFSDEKSTINIDHFILPSSLRRAAPYHMFPAVTISSPSFICSARTVSLRRVASASVPSSQITRNCIRKIKIQIPLFYLVPCAHFTPA